MGVECVVGGIGCGGLLMDGLERFFFLASSSLVGNYEQQRSHICNVVRRFLLSFELFISAFCPQVLLSSWSTFPFLFTLFFWAEQCLWTYLWHSIISKADYGTGSDRSRFIRNEYCSFSVVFLSPRLAYMNLQMNPICSQVSFGSVFYSAPVSFTLPSSPPIPRKVKTTNNTLQNLCI